MDNRIALICVMALLAMMVICAVKESRVTGIYKTFGVYGRLLAYLFVDGVLVFALGFACVLGVLKFWLLPSLLLMVLGLAIAACLYLYALRKCPDAFKDGLLISMLISGFGVFTKIACFFIVPVWSLVLPPSFIDDYGRTIYTIDDFVYDKSGRKIGIVDPYNHNRYLCLF